MASLNRNAAKDIARAKKLATLMDSAFEVPWIRYRIGWDALLGLIPGVGDGLGAVLALYPLYVAVQWNLPAAVMSRMILNIGIDTLSGMIPVVGDIVDAGFKANLRNVALLEEALANHTPPKDVVIDV
jgi:hypothetical protein